MKKLFITLLLIPFALIVNADDDFEFSYKDHYDSLQKLTQDEDNPLHYDKLFKRFDELDEDLTNFEVLTLMIGYTAQPFYVAYGNFLSIEVIKLTNEGKYKKAIKEGLKVLEKQPMNADAIYYMSIACSNAEEYELARKYKMQFRWIMRAMEFSGDGKSPDTPMFAMGALDGQLYVRSYLKGKIISAGSAAGVHGFCDISTAKIKKKKVTYYFAIQHAMNKMWGK